MVITPDPNTFSLAQPAGCHTATTCAIVTCLQAWLGSIAHVIVVDPDVQRKIASISAQRQSFAVFTGGVVSPSMRTAFAVCRRHKLSLQ